MKNGSIFPSTDPLDEVKNDIEQAYEEDKQFVVVESNHGDGSHSTVMIRLSDIVAFETR